MLLWQEKFETGHSTIDTQHKMLVTYINRLEGLLNTTNPNRQDCEFIINLVDFMESYVDSHFRFEEQCMDSYRCPAHQKNKLAHQEFLQFFRRFKEQYEAGGFRQEILANLHQNTQGWVLGHILQIDMQLKTCLSRPANP